MINTSTVEGFERDSSFWQRLFTEDRDACIYKPFELHKDCMEYMLQIMAECGGDFE